MYVLMAMYQIQRIFSVESYVRMKVNNEFHSTGKKDFKSLVI